MYFLLFVTLGSLKCGWGGLLGTGGSFTPIIIQNGWKSNKLGLLMYLLISVTAGRLLSGSMAGRQEMSLVYVVSD